MKALLAAAALIGALAAGPSFAQTTTTATAQAVRAADIAWAKHAQEVSVAQAFRDTMDPTDGLQFEGGPPVRGAEAIYKAMGGEAANKTHLEWSPTDAWGAASGDMGVTAGTWRAWTTDASRPELTGRYVTVWRKDPKGVWKALIDIGNPDPK